MLPDESTTRGDTAAAAPGQLEGLVVAPGRLAAKPLVDFLRAERLNLQLLTDHELAFEEALLHPPDVLLIDGGMAPAGGVELIARLKGNLRTHFVPAALWLRGDDRSQRLRAWAAGADALFGPGVDAQEQRTRLWALLRTHALHRRQARRLQDHSVALRARRRWVDGFVHDLQSSLAAMQANFEFMLGRRGGGASRAADGQADGDLDECVRDTRSLFVDLKRGLRSVLDYERWESGGLDLFRQPTTVAALVAPITDELAAVADVLGKRLAVETGASAEQVVNVDSRLLSAALFNLAAYLLREPVNHAVTARVERDTEVLRFVHAADGESSEDLGTLFEPYSRRPEPTRIGHGVGLALARAVAELHGGRLLADRDGGPGARRGKLRFVLELPLAPQVEGGER